jgi:murein DD-endopeptidase MepM/ murein hydrolase activator NlpD
MSFSIGNNEKCGLLFRRIFTGPSAALTALKLILIGAAVSAAAPASADTAMDSHEEDSAAIPSALGDADADFRAIFASWRKMDSGVRTSVSIPSRKPVDNLVLTSSYGVRSNPFNGHRRAHKGIDIPGPVGTPIYATADGVVARSEWASGYGNLVAINHGNGIETRYGHMSKLIVGPNEYVRRGQLIGLMGSTGRSTGSHLHYEVRIDGEAVNPMPFVESSDYVIAMSGKPPVVAMGGPEKE